MVTDHSWGSRVTGWARVQLEQPEDRDAVRGVLCRAFGGEAEARVVDRLRRDNALTCSLVARHDNFTGPEAVLGHICFSPVTVNGEYLSPLAVGLAPLTVCPRWQNQGIGSALVRAGLHVCWRMGIGLVFVVGSPTYYPRFDFEPASRHGFTWNQGNVGPAFQVVGLRTEPKDHDGGEVAFHKAFDAVAP